MHKSKKVYFLLGFLVIIVLVETTIIFIQRKRFGDENQISPVNNANIVDLRYGDNFSVIPVVDVEGKEVSLKCGENNILFYLSSSCSSCGDVLRFCERLQAVFGEDNLNILLLWNDSIPISLVEKNNIPLENCYTTNSMTGLNSPTPTAYILDDQGSILYFSSDIKTSIERLYAQVAETENMEEELRLRANEYLIEAYGISDFHNPQVVYFYMSGCPDCAVADEFLNTDEEKDKRDLYYLYKYDDTEPSHYKDDYALFRTVYGIEWYPSFLVFSSEQEYRIVGEVPVETLTNELDKFD